MLRANFFLACVFEMCRVFCNPQYCYSGGYPCSSQPCFGASSLTPPRSPYGMFGSTGCGGYYCSPNQFPPSPAMSQIGANINTGTQCATCQYPNMNQCRNMQSGPCQYPPCQCSPVPCCANPCSCPCPYSCGQSNPYQYCNPQPTPYGSSQCSCCPCGSVPCCPAAPCEPNPCGEETNPYRRTIYPSADPFGFSGPIALPCYQNPLPAMLNKFSTNIAKLLRAVFSNRHLNETVPCCLSQDIETILNHLTKCFETQARCKNGQYLRIISCLREQLDDVTAEYLCS